jgi:hypothetical protein
MSTLNDLHRAGVVGYGRYCNHTTTPEQSEHPDKLDKSWLMADQVAMRREFRNNPHPDYRGSRQSWKASCERYD